VDEDLTRRCSELSGSHAFSSTSQYQSGGLLTDVTTLVNGGQTLQSEVQNGGLAARQPSDTDFAAFQADVATLADDCEMHVIYPWAVQAQQNGTI
jgi:hypothetical protein